MLTKLNRLVLILALTFLFLFVQTGSGLVLNDSTFTSVAFAQKKGNTQPGTSIPQQIDNLQQQINTIELTPGRIGLQGLKGDTGAPGATGPQGDTGVAGTTGSQGPQGDTGLAGASGATGLKGDTGVAGAPGATGPQGPQGDTGADGATGPAGPIGPTGPQGDPGNLALGGMFCPQAQFVVGFSLNGSLVCASLPGVEGSTTTDPAATIHVASRNPAAIDDTTCGAAILPCLTINYGISRAVAVGLATVAVAQGNYPEVVLLDHVDVLGGFNTGFTARILPDLAPVISGDGSSSATVVVGNLTQPVTFEGFNVIGQNMNLTAGGNTYAVYIIDSSSHLTFSRNIVMAGIAGNGSTGVNGETRVLAFEELSGFAAVGDPFGFGGSTFGGGIGGPVGTPPADRHGKPGTGPGAGGSGGLGGLDGGYMDVDCLTITPPTNGGPGSVGLNGAYGSHGTGGAGGSVINDEWVTVSGTPGSYGIVGGGQGGGGSFGIFIVNSQPSLAGNEIHLGQAGNGGIGGERSFGLSGGVGGPIDSQVASGGSGRGGDGGNGGHGGGGAGGLP